MSGWWIEQYARFTIAVTPTVTTGGSPVARAAMTVPVTPSFVMDPTSVSTASMTLPVIPAVSFVGLTYIGTVALNLVPSIAMSAAGRSTASFGISVTPAIGITGAEKYTASFTLVVTPAFPFTGATKQLPHAIPWTI